MSPTQQRPSFQPSRRSPTPAWHSGKPPVQLSQPSAHLQRTLQKPSHLTSTEVLYLQRVAGNRAVTNLLSPRPTVQRTVASPDASVGAEGGALDGVQEAQIRSPRGSSQAVPEPVRRQVEAKTGAEVGEVKVYNNKSSHALNRKLNARAFTHDNRIFLGQGESPHDTQLMAHELTHTIQQTGGEAKAQRSPLIQRFSEDDAEHGPTDWEGETVRAKVGQPGVTGEPFFMTDINGFMLVVKRVKGKSGRYIAPGQTMFGDKVLSKLGIRTPKSRIISPSSDEGSEYQKLVHIITIHNNDECNPQSPKFKEKEFKSFKKYLTKNGSYFKVMSKAQGTKMGDEFDAMRTLEDAQKFFSKVQENGYAYFWDMGKAMVGDAVIGNEDRFFGNLGHKNNRNEIDKLTVNQGNVFFDDEHNLEAIDSDPTLGNPGTVGQISGGAFDTNLGDIINPLFDKRKEGDDPEMDTLEISHGTSRGLSDKLELFLAAFIRDIPGRLMQGRGGQKDEMVAYVDQWYQENKHDVLEAFRKGVAVGLVALEEFMHKDNKEERTKLKHEISDYGDEHGAQMWVTFNARARYMLDRHSGMTEEEALEKSYMYQRKRYGKLQKVLDIPESQEQGGFTLMEPGETPPQEEGTWQFGTKKEHRNEETRPLTTREQHRLRVTQEKQDKLNQQNKLVKKMMKWKKQRKKKVKR